MDAFEAARDGDLAAVRAALDAGFDAAAVDEYGWSLLHRAAMGAEADPGLDGLVGFCYYTRQDAERARETGHLLLAFWGAPDGSTRRTEHAGELVVRAFRGAGFAVDRNGAADSRPSVGLTG